MITGRSPTHVLPTYRGSRGFWRATRTEMEEGTWSGGDSRWRCLLRLPDPQITTLNKSAAEIHQIGLDEVKRDEAEMLAIVHQLGFADLKSFRASLVQIRKNIRIEGGAARYLQGYIAQMQPRLPELFGRLPKAKLEVVADAGVRGEELVRWPTTMREQPDGSGPGT